MYRLRVKDGRRIISLLYPAFTLTMAVSTGAHAQPVPSQGTWETTLLGRDIDGNSVSAGAGNAVFLYDTALNITWLKNANSNGQMIWSDANAWANTLQVGEFSGWRLPSTLIPDSSCVAANDYPAVYSQGYGVGCSGSEMGHLFNVALGNITGPISNGGNFQRLESYYYWSKTPLASDSYYVWTYNIAINGQAYTGTGTNSIFAMAVREGDVLASVPEPAISTMALAGLAVIWFWRRSRQTF